MPAPPSDVVRVRSRWVCDGVSLLAVIGYLVVFMLLEHQLRRLLGHDVGTLAWQFLPWLIGLPVLRRVSLAPSQWLVLSFVCPLNFLLLGRLTHRFMSLPARDWAPAWWELDRIQPFAENPRFWLLGPTPAEPVHVRLAPPPGAPLRHRLMWTSRRAWVVVFPAAVMAFLFRDAMSTWLGLLAIPVFPALILVAIAPELAWRAVRTTQKSQKAAATAA